jgi:hypothetical protein
MPVFRAASVRFARRRGEQERADTLCRARATTNSSDTAIARRRTEPGWRAAVLDERADTSFVCERGRQRLQSASLSERSEQCHRGGSGGVLPLFDCSLRSLRIASECRLLCRRSPTEKRVGSLLRSTAARYPVRATTTDSTAPRIARRCPGRTNEQTRFSSAS